jgi:aspartate carbamoyltransferase catalytic subunit
MRQHFKGRGIEGLKVGYVGDVRHSRVARSSVWAHLALGNEVRLIGPKTLVPEDFARGTFGEGKVQVFDRLEPGLEGLDVVVALRMQLERQEEHYVPNLDEYSREYCISERLLAKVAPNSIVIHPGPMNRGTEITSDVADGPRSLIRQQVTNGVAVRMAVLYLLARTVQSVEEVAHG